MPLLQILEVLVVVGVLLWLVNRFIPMQGSIKSILNGVVVIAVVLWLLNVFGLFHSLSRIHVGTLLIPQSTSAISLKMSHKCINQVQLVSAARSHFEIEADISSRNRP